MARLLQAKGWEVEVFLYGDPVKLPLDAKVNYDRWLALGGVFELNDAAIDGYWEDHPDTKIAIDAVFGTGLTRPFTDLAKVQLELNYWQAASRRNGAPKVVSIDIPSGVCSDSGQYLGSDQDNPFDYGVMSNLTVSFHREKLGHRLSGGAVGSGKVIRKSIGIPHQGSPNSTVSLIETLDTSVLKAGSHKYTHGHALVLSGGHGKTGAARLAARGALRIGAGLVTLGSPRSAMHENAAQLTAIMLHQIDGAHGVSELLEDERLNAICLGPGLGRGLDTQAVVVATLKARRATVLDADALTRFERDPQVLFDLLHENCVLTPHGGEFAKLFPDLAERLSAVADRGPAYSKVDATREAAARAGCIVLFKGADTVIAAPDGRCSVNSAQYERTAPWLATAGAGDVLAGIITGLLARRFSPMQAAEMGAWLHVECAREYGPGLIAEDLPEQLPSVLRRFLSC
ncbi:YjeF family protein [Roseobacter sp. MED193]|nr:YjeF family protein [Roseobacter sp. MED193]